MINTGDPEAAIAETIETTDFLASRYFETHSSTYNVSVHLSDFVAKLPANAKILDVGCGPGRDARYFCDKGARVTGIDLSSETLKIARSTAPDAHFVIMDMRSLDLVSTSFDGIWCCASLYHLPKVFVNTTLTEFYRVLKPG